MIDLPLISIIIPVYNAAKYLDRCISSILRQSYVSWELLLIDDGSTDDSGIICTLYSLRDSRISYFKKENGGVSSARNAGLDMACGEYLTFIDADDYISDLYLSELLSNCNSDLTISGFEIVDDRLFIPETDGNISLNNANSLVKLFDSPYYLDTPWAKLFRRSIIKENKLRFDENMKLSEDTLFCYQYLYFCNSIHMIPQALYIYDGKWGGESKYKLSYTEIDYMSNAIVSAIDNINSKFGSYIDSTYKCFHIGKMNNLFSDYSDKEIYNLYLKSHQYIDINDFLGDVRLSPLVTGILYAQKLVEHKDECINFLHELSNFVTTPINRIRFHSYKHCVFFLALKYVNPLFAYWIVKLSL